MKLYHIYQDVNNYKGVYSEAIVAADSFNEAKTFHPNGIHTYFNGIWVDNKNNVLLGGHTWVRNIDDISIHYLGEATNSVKKGIIMRAFHD